MAGLLGVIVVLMFCSPALAAETAGEFVSLCATVTAAPTNKTGQLSFEPTFESGRCWGAFAAVQELSRIKRDVDKAPLLGICAPERTTRRQLVEIFADYVRSHPEAREQQFAVVVIIALEARFPCDGTP